MKKMVMAIFGLVFSLGLFASPAVDSSASIKVFGNCGMCKSRIEKAAKAAGASVAVWNDETKMLDLKFNVKKTDLDKIEQKVVATGHDTEKYKATDEAYNKLPGCCLYRDSETGH